MAPQKKPQLSARSSLSKDLTWKGRQVLLLFAQPFPRKGSHPTPRALCINTAHKPLSLKADKNQVALGLQAQKWYHPILKLDYTLSKILPVMLIPSLFHRVHPPHKAYKNNRWKFMVSIVRFKNRNCPCFVMQSGEFKVLVHLALNSSIYFTREKRVTS